VKDELTTTSKELFRRSMKKNELDLDNLRGKNNGDEETTAPPSSVHKKNSKAKKMIAVTAGIKKRKMTKTITPKDTNFRTNGVRLRTILLGTLKPLPENCISWEARGKKEQMIRERDTLMKGRKSNA